MWSEIRTLFWLQFRLTCAVFRGRRLSDRLHMLGQIRRLLAFVFTVPFFALMGVALAVGLVLLSPRAAYELTTIVNVGLFGFWLLMPATYSTQTIERFEMTRLFAYPVRFRSIVIGSTLISALSMTGLWTVPLLLGEIVGLAWHRPAALPLILLGALPTFVLLALTGRIMEDVFDLVAGDRRLRALVLSLFMLPLLLCWVGQYGIQFAIGGGRLAVGRWLPQWDQLALREMLGELRRSEGIAEFLEVLGISRLLIWLPPGWSTAGMASALVDKWMRSLVFTSLSVVFTGGLLWAHAQIVRHLNRGAALRVGTERVLSRSLSSSEQRIHLPGPASFWGLLRKDWLYLRRSPLPRRLFFSAVLSSLGMVFALSRELPRRFSEVIALAVVALSVTVISLAVNLGLTANYFGAVDREGYATLAYTGVDRRQVLLSANLISLVFVLVICALLALIIALVTRAWVALPLGLYLAVCIQIGSSPAYNLAAILAPFRAHLQISGSRGRGNVWGVLAWLVSAAPVLALTVLSYLYWRPGLPLTLPLGVVYSVGLYVLTLRPLTRLLQVREYEMLKAVTYRE